MKITPIGYNYSNQKTQKSDSKTQFGMALNDPAMLQYLEDSIPTIMAYDIRRVLLESVRNMADHPLGVVFKERVFKIMSPDGNASKVITGNLDPNNVINRITIDLQKYTRLTNEAAAGDVTTLETELALLRQSHDENSRRILNQTLDPAQKLPTDDESQHQYDQEVQEIAQKTRELERIKIAKAKLEAFFTQEESARKPKPKT
jgi:hypothetical protein